MQTLIRPVLIAILVMLFLSGSAHADITCYDFTMQADAQVVLEALPGDPYGLDVGWPPSSPQMGDREAGNGIACDTGSDIPEVASPGDEAYEIGVDSFQNGRTELPADVEQVTIASVEGATSFSTVEDADLEYAVNGVATPEFEPGANYESDVFAVQCGAEAANTRVQELLAPGTVVWLEVDEAYWGGNLGLNRTSRHVWTELDGRFRLLAEVLISEGHGVAAPERPGTGRGDATTNPPTGIMYRDALRAAQQIAIDHGVGLWTACA